MNPVRRSGQDRSHPRDQYYDQHQPAPSKSYRKMSGHKSNTSCQDCAASSSNHSSSICTTSYNHPSHIPLATTYQSHHHYLLGRLPPFQDYLQRVWMNRPGRRCSSAISRSLHNKIVDFLQHNTSTTPKFKYWVKSKRFILINNYLAVPAGTGRKRSKSASKLFLMKSSSTNNSSQRSGISFIVIMTYGNKFAC